MDAVGRRREDRRPASGARTSRNTGTCSVAVLPAWSVAKIRIRLQPVAAGLEPVGLGRVVLAHGNRTASPVLRSS